MAEYFNERSLLQGSATPQFDVGSITRAGALTQQALGSVRDRELEDAKFAREKQRFDREQLMNQRADTEYQREIGLRDTRKSMADEFLTNPYGAKFGADKETADLDKSVLDYVNKGGEINDDLAGRLQARYEQARPFREDAVNAITGNLVAAGEDPTKALATATALGSNLLGRADIQARADANRESQQKWYDAQAKANLEANKLNLDVGKVNLNAQKDLIEARMKQFGGGGATGGTAGMPGGDFTKVQEQVATWDLGPLDRAKAIEFADKAKEMGYNANQVMTALKGSVDLDVGSVVSDKKVDGELFKGVLAKMAPGATIASGNTPQLNQAYTAESLMPQFAPRQVVGYDPKKFLEGSRDTLPEIVGAREKVLTGEPTSRVGTSSVSTKMPDSLVQAEGVRNTPYKDSKGNVTVGVGYAFNKSMDEVKRDFKDAGIPEEKIPGLMAMDGTKLTSQEVSSLADVAYDRYGVKKLDNIGIDVEKLNPRLAEIGVSQAYRGDIVKNGDGYQGELYKYLKNNDLEGMTDYVKNSKEVPKEVKTRLGLVVNREGPISKEEAIYNKIPTEAPVTTRSAEDLRKELDALNKSEGGTDRLDRLVNLNKEYAQAKEIENEQKYKRNLLEMLGVDTGGRNKGYGLGKDDNAAETEKGLVDTTATLIPWGKVASKPIEVATPYVSKGAEFVNPVLGKGADRLQEFLSATPKKPFTIETVGNGAAGKAAEMMNVLRSPNIRAGEAQATKDGLVEIARQYPELRQDIVRFLQQVN